MAAPLVDFFREDPDLKTDVVSFFGRVFGFLCMLLPLRFVVFFTSTKEVMVTYVILWIPVLGVVWCAHRFASPRACFVKRVLRVLPDERAVVQLELARHRRGARPA